MKFFRLDYWLIPDKLNDLATNANEGLLDQAIVVLDKAVFIECSVLHS